MRIKEEILNGYEDEVNYKKPFTNASSQGHFFLEVLIDIRDQLTILSTDLGILITTLENIETNIRVGK